MPNFRISDEDFVRSYMEHYRQMPILEWAALIMGYKTNNASSVKKRTDNMRRRGIKLPEWKFQGSAHIEGYKTSERIAEMNAIIKGFGSTSGSDREMKKPPV